jgi:hypothetical protein
MKFEIRVELKALDPSCGIYYSSFGTMPVLPVENMAKADLERLVEFAGRGATIQAFLYMLNDKQIAWNIYGKP